MKTSCPQGRKWCRIAAVFSAFNKICKNRERGKKNHQECIIYAVGLKKKISFLLSEVSLIIACKKLFGKYFIQGVHNIQWKTL